MSLFKIQKATSVQVDKTSKLKPRTKYAVLSSAMSELGELAVEVAISEHHSYKKPSPDGIVGEAVDTILCLLDLIHVYDPSVTEEDLNEIAKLKCVKWVDKISQ